MFHCVSCGHSAHAGTVGALNVLQTGLVRREAQPAWREATGFGRGRSHIALTDLMARRLTDEPTVSWLHRQSGNASWIPG